MEEIYGVEKGGDEQGNIGARTVSTFQTQVEKNPTTEHFFLVFRSTLSLPP